MEDNVIARLQNSENIMIEEIKTGIWCVCVYVWGKLCMYMEVMMVNQRQECSGILRSIFNRG